MSTMSFSNVRMAMGLVDGLSSLSWRLTSRSNASLVHTADSSRAACAMHASKMM